jgi:hypothetical protein
MLATGVINVIVTVSRGKEATYMKTFTIDENNNITVSAEIKRPQNCRFCRSAPPSAWAGTR